MSYFSSPSVHILMQELDGTVGTQLLDGPIYYGNWPL
jgi:hypothetical protein